eukprot:TRINITY_DN879_c0_g1_i2.p1 TRINITY_DN879_c0_g1~~TRINITY_DN879_c0_g1_i2.p1  ORF type:complete len:349 (+),score=126.14 TRINITY_DN879_c0_g1_i2:141-1187(+)
MKIKIRTMRNENIDIEIEPEQTVDHLKTLVEEKTQQPKAWQKLIYSGKILADENTVGSYNIKEGGFVVLFSKQPKAGEKAEPEKAAAPASPAPAQPAAPASPAPTAQPAAASPAQAQPAQGGNLYSNAASAFVTDDALEAMVMQIMEMGFEREQILRALNAANRNPDIAVQLLLSGNVPETPASPQGQPQAPASPQGPAQGGAQGGQGGGAFDFLRNNPQFNMLRALVQANPQSLQGILQQLGQSNPQILQIINENQEEFLALLQEPVDPSALGGMGGMGGGAPGQGVIQVTQAEKEAIDRLCSLGFDRNSVIEAFFACDKDEQLAANYLLEGGGFDDDDDFGGDDNM